MHAMISLIIGHQTTLILTNEIDTSTWGSPMLPIKAVQFKSCCDMVNFSKMFSPHSELIRAKYGVSFVCSELDLCSSFVTTLLLYLVFGYYKAIKTLRPTWGYPAKRALSAMHKLCCWHRCLQDLGRQYKCWGGDKIRDFYKLSISCLVAV